MPHDFTAKLQALVSLELTRTKRADPAGMAAMIEGLTNSLGLVIAVSAGGSPPGVQELLTGTEAYLYEAATQHRRWQG